MSWNNPSPDGDRFHDGRTGEPVSDEDRAETERRLAEHDEIVDEAVPNAED